MTPTKVLPVVLLASCLERWDAVAVEDEGDLCLYVGEFDPWATAGNPAGTETTFTSEDPIVIHYVPLYCFSGSCTRNIQIDCEAEVADDQIVIQGTASWEVAAGLNQACTTDCGLGDGQCVIDPLADGTYEITFGDASDTLVVPSTDTICFHR
jgi:hypothetical protein